MELNYEYAGPLSCDGGPAPFPVPEVLAAVSADLDAREIRYAVIGGAALKPETYDVDFEVDRFPQEPERPRIIGSGSDSASLLRCIGFDLLIHQCRDFHELVISRAAVRELFGVRVRTASLEDVLLIKLMAVKSNHIKSEKHREEVLQYISGADLGYMRQTAEILGISALLEELKI